MMLTLSFACLSLLAGSTARSIYDSSFSHGLEARQSSNDSSVTVDLGYATYQGYRNASTDLNTFLGIRFAAPPTGANRFQKPQPPVQNLSSVIQADTYAPTCYQSPSGSTMINPANQTLAAEDCLFLNVWSPASSSTNNTSGGLPVFVWIHGGGYGAGSGRQDLSTLINTNNNSFVGVTIQYRLGAFGFLSSDEISRYGTPNAGIYDQTFALQWVQRYIQLFGGDPTHVTIGGESAGGGSVMLQDMAYGGSLGTSLFRNTFAASPYLPMQYDYNAWQPTQSYYAMASAVGCAPGLPYGHVSSTIFECLQTVDEQTLANASATISQSGTFGTWAFLPTTDYALIPGLPSEQLLQRKINGLNILVGNNANEGPGFTPQNISTENELEAWLNLTFPLFAPNDVAKILRYYPSDSSSSSGLNSSDDFATSGYEGPNAVNQSYVATGEQQRANNIYGETTFVCPSYWLAEAYTPSGATQRRSYKYQYSVPPALHGADGSAYFSPPNTQNVGEDMSLAFKTLLGNFIVYDNPSIPLEIAMGASSMNSSSDGNTNSTTSGQPISGGQVGAGSAAIAAWPPFSLSQPWQIDLNQTGGTPTQVPSIGKVNITEYYPPGVQNSIGLYDAYDWEGGRGIRCDFWRSVGRLVPE